jgi:site-specific recombinase XerD
LPSHILIQRHETKNDYAINFPIPADAARLIQRYTDEARPHLAENGNPFLFPGNGQESLSVSQVRQVFKDHVGGATGVDAYPHVMRHFAGLLFLEHRPGQYEVLRRILGHKDVETTRAFYTGLETDMACKVHDEAVLSQRAAGRAMLKNSSKSPSSTRPSRQGRRN